MRETRIANRYAKALFELSLELDQLDHTRDDMELLHLVCRQNREFVLMLKSPIIKETKKQAILQDIFEKKMHELTYKFLMVITRNKREDILTEIAEQYIKIFKEYKNILPTILTSAVKLDEGTRNKIIQILGDRANATIELTEEIDEEIIGGFILEFADQQYDASLQRKIKNLRKDFEVNYYIKGF